MNFIQNKTKMIDAKIEFVRNERTENGLKTVEGTDYQVDRHCRVIVEWIQTRCEIGKGRRG